MTGFLDKNTRVLDMVLTSHGKYLLSRSELHFCYWIPYDDEIAYDPFIAESGSMSGEQLTSSIYQAIESTPIREATTGYRSFNSSGSDFTNVHMPMFTTAQGQKILPRVIFASGSNEITTKQRRIVVTHKDANQQDVTNQMPAPSNDIDHGVERFDSTQFTLQYSYSNESFSTDFQPDGFFLRIFKSGSSGLTEVRSKHDTNNDMSYSNDIKIFTRGE
jgi:hypothetical protein